VSHPNNKRKEKVQEGEGTSEWGGEPISEDSEGEIGSLETGEDSDSTEWSLEPGEMEEEDECNFSEEEEEVRVEKEIQNPKKREAPILEMGRSWSSPPDVWSS
jgi:hypothetical protein